MTTRLALAIALGLPAAVGAQGPIPAESRQLVVVVTTGWTATRGTLHQFARAGTEAPWSRVGAGVPVVVGRAGLGWGRGLHGRAGAGPVKSEGDGRAPAGVFALTAGFGYAPADSVDTGLPYVRATRDVECVDDSESTQYNRIVDRTEVVPDWSSHEEMRRGDILYRRGVVVDHNASPTVAGGGSCIFIHVWRGPDSTTSGCTAMAEDELATAMAWLTADAAPLLVQLPAAEYARLRRSWGLPSLR